MEIIFYHPTFDTQYWICELEKQLPGARVREWKAGDNRPADYALVWHPLVEMLQGRALKAEIGRASCRERVYLQV